MHFKKLKSDSTIFDECKNIFKVGGRYSLNDQFDYSKYNCSLDVMRTIPKTLVSYNCVWTSCFKISLENLESFFNMLNSIEYQNKFHNWYEPDQIYFLCLL